MNSYGQFGIEAQIPINRATGTDTGTPAQVRFFFDDISANSIGKPLFRRHRSSLMKLHTRIRAIVAAPMVAACQFARARLPCPSDVRRGLDGVRLSERRRDRPRRGATTDLALVTHDPTKKKHMSVALNLRTPGLYTVSCVRSPRTATAHRGATRHRDRSVAVHQLPYILQMH
jgi:hypothetical protein